MKTSKLLLAIAFLSISTVFAQKSNIEKDLKMYEQVWSDIVNKGRIELIHDKNFDPNVVQIKHTGNLEGITAFRDYIKFPHWLF